MKSLATHTTRRFVLHALVLLVVASTANCASTSTGAKFNGTNNPNGSPVVFQNTTNYAVHLLFGKFPLLGNASVEGSVDSFTKASRKNGNTVEITNMSQTAFWIVLPPFSFILTPVITDTYGYVYK